MTAAAKHLKTLMDRAELESVLLKYYYAVDSLSDIEGLLDCFTSDSVFDVADLGLEVYQGHDAIRSFFEGVFATTAHHCHHVTNFDVTRLEDNEASARGYVMAKAEGKNGQKLVVHCCYYIEYVRT